MAEYLIQDTTLDAIADAINAKTGGSSAMTPAEMVTEIAAIPSGGGITPTGTKQISITQNGTTTEDVTQYANAEITVNVPSGASLPSVISKIDGGSFTLAASTYPGDYWITHSLGVAPKGFSIWTNSRPPANGVDPVGFVNVYLSYDPGSGRQGYYAGNKLWHDQPTSESIIAGWITAPTQYADSTRFRWWATAAKYEAGVTYNWLAWA